MPRYRFHIRTIMIAIVAGTPLMGVLRHWPALHAPVTGILVLAAIAAFLVGVVIEFAAFATYLSRGRTRPRQVLRDGQPSDRETRPRPIHAGSPTESDRSRTDRDREASRAASRDLADLIKTRSWPVGTDRRS